VSWTELTSLRFETLEVASYFVNDLTLIVKVFSAMHQ